MAPLPVSILSQACLFPISSTHSCSDRDCLRVAKEDCMQMLRARCDRPVGLWLLQVRCDWLVRVVFVNSRYDVIGSSGFV